VGASKRLRYSSNAEIREKVFFNQDMTLAEQKAAYEFRCRRRQVALRKNGPQPRDSDPKSGDATTSSSAAGRIFVNSRARTDGASAGAVGVSGDVSATKSNNPSAGRLSGLLATAPAFVPGASSGAGSALHPPTPGSMLSCGGGGPATDLTWSRSSTAAVDDGGQAADQSASALTFDHFGAPPTGSADGPHSSVGDGRHQHGIAFS
jgi:hypothetical protein